MDFNYTPEDQAFRSEVRAWLEANKKFAPPPSNIMADEGAGDWEARVNWHKKLNEGGWVAVNWPKEYGGRGATVMQRLIYREELGRLGLKSRIGADACDRRRRRLRRQRSESVDLDGAACRHDLRAGAHRSRRTQ